MRKPSLQGFTLLEFLIAVTILSMMAAVAYSSLRMGLSSYEKSQERLEARARQRIMEELVRRQLGSLFPAQPGGGFVSDEELNQTPVGPLTGGRQGSPLFYGTSQSLTFVTLVPFNLVRNPGLAVVRYGLAEDIWGNRYFGALETQYTGLESFESMVDIPPGEPLTVYKGVDEVEFEYYGLDPQSQTYAWFSEWNGEEVSTVPEAVRITAGEHHLVANINTTAVGGLRSPQRNLFQRLINQR